MVTIAAHRIFALQTTHSARLDSAIAKVVTLSVSFERCSPNDSLEFARFPTTAICYNFSFCVATIGRLLKGRNSKIQNKSIKIRHLWLIFLCSTGKYIQPVLYQTQEVLKSTSRNWKHSLGLQQKSSLFIIFQQWYWGSFSLAISTYVAD